MDNIIILGVVSLESVDTPFQSPVPLLLTWFVHSVAELPLARPYIYGKARYQNSFVTSLRRCYRRRP
jgi:hypothetical protein